MTNSLAGKSVLITRAAHQASELASLIRQRGGDPILFPTIEIVPPRSWEIVDRMIEALYMYDGLIFTSANGVEFFMQRFRESGTDASILSSKLVYVVGEKTAQAVRHHGMNVTLMPEKFTSQDLAKTIDHRDMTGRSFLFPRGALGKDILQDTLKLLGAHVDAVTVYETRKPAEEDLRAMRTKVLNGQVDVITFTSPSTFHNFVQCFSKEEVDRLFARSAIVVIGPVTAKAVAEAGFEPGVVSHSSTIESLVDAICGFIGKPSPKNGAPATGRGKP